MSLKNFSRMASVGLAVALLSSPLRAGTPLPQGIQATSETPSALNQNLSGRTGCSAKQWKRFLEPPKEYSFEHSVRILKSYSFEDFDAELLEQANGPGTAQRVLKVFPKRFEGKIPAVVVPFYFPEAMIGFELETGEPLGRYLEITMMADLARRGFCCISADSYHLTYIEQALDRRDFRRWKNAGEALMRDYPQWTGMGKLVADTRLLVDLLEEDPRVDSRHIGIIGHSLGGKMAFYTGCLDSRIKVIVASDFGFLWEQSNWEKVWYWGDKLEDLKAAGMDHSGLLSLSHGKPFMLIAGKYDDDRSYEAMLRARGYRRHPQRLRFLNHATGHRPPKDALDAGYAFLESWLR